MKSEEEIKNLLEAWKKDPVHREIRLEDDIEAAVGKLVIEMLTWILK